MFQQCLAYQETIILCYGCHVEALDNRIPSTQTQTIAKAICDVLSHVVTTCVINQHHGYWLLSYALALAINLYVKFSKERLELQVEINAIEEMDMRMKVKLLGTNMRGHVIIAIKPFLDFMFFFKPIKAHNMVVLMVNL